MKNKHQPIKWVSLILESGLPYLMRKEYPYIMVILMFIFGCSTADKNANQAAQFSLNLIDSLEFHIGFSFMDHPSGTFYDRETKQRCYYFGNIPTNKILKVFSESGAFIDAVQLDSVQSRTPISEVEIWSMDTILALSEYTGQLFFLNRSGRVWKQVDLASLLERDSIWYFELSSSYFSTMNSSSNSIVLSLNAAIRPEFQARKGIQFYTEEVWNKAQFVKFESIFSDSIHYTSGFPMYKAIAPEDSSLLNIELKSFVISEGAIYTHSYYSDRIFQLDVKTLELKEEYQIKSSYKALGKRVSTKNKTDGEIMTLMRNNAGAGMLARHFFNEWKHHHYLVVSIDEENWSLLIYNEKFSLVGEQKYSDKEYRSFILSSEEGFFLQKAVETVQHYQEQKLKFHEFTY